MTNWVLIAIVGYLFFSLNSVSDKILLTTAVSRPYVYVFFNGILSSAVLVLLFFGVDWIPFNYILLSLIGGACWAAALYFYYSAVQLISISRLQPIQGGLVPLFTLLLSSFFLDEHLSVAQFIAFGFLVSGAVLISFKKTHGSWHLPAVNFSIVASFLFASHFVISKIIFDHYGFINGLFWTRWGMFLFALVLLISAKHRKEIRSTEKHSTSGNRLLFYFSRLCGAIAGILQNYAIAIGSVTIVKALQSVQFTFVLLFASIISAYYPKILKEVMTRNILIQKVIAIVLVVVGLVILGYTT